MLTKNGVCYNLEVSPYIVKKGNLVFHFSSELYRQKFLEDCDIFCYSVYNTIKSRLNINVALEKIELVLYARLEKRGFYVVDGEEVITCRDSLIFLGGVAKSKN